MSNEDELRCWFAGCALVGLTMREGVGTAMEYDAWALADKMIAIKESSKKDNQEPEVEMGIVAAKPKRKTKSA
jgi:hypothetical protein